MKILLLVFLSTFLSACTTIYTSRLDYQIVGNAYPKYPKKADEIDKYKSELAELDKKFTQDDKGTYYIELDSDNGVFMTGFKNGDMDVLKQVLTTSVGLMEPLYKFNKSGKIVFNEYGTEKRHAFLIDNVGLKLLPLSDTNAYAKLIQQFAQSEANRILNGGIFAGVKGVGSGNLGFYSNDYHTRVTSSISKNFDYVVQNPGTKRYSAELQNKLVLAGYQTQSADSGQTASDALNRNIGFEAAANSIMSMYDIYFVPLKYYENTKKNVAYNLPSGCRYTDFGQTERYLKHIDSLTRIPYFSTLSSLAKAKDPQVQKKSRDIFDSAFELQGQIRTNTQEACLKGLAALDVNGVVESRRLN